MGSEIKVVEVKIANLLSSLDGMGSTYQACLASTKVESSTVTVESCNQWIDKITNTKNDISALSSLLNNLKTKAAALDASISKLESSGTPAPRTYSYNERSSFDAAVTSLYSKFVGDLRSKYQKYGWSESYTEPVPGPPNFSNTTDGTNEDTVNGFGLLLSTWWQKQNEVFNGKVAAAANPTTPTQTNSLNDQNTFNSQLSSIYAKYVDDIKAQLKAIGNPSITIDTVPSAPVFSNTQDGTNEAAFLTYIKVFQAWHSKQLARIKSESKAPTENKANAYDTREVFEEQVSHYYEKYVNGAMDWMKELGVAGGFLISPPAKPNWTNTTDGTNDRLVNSFISQISVWWQAQNDRLQPLQDQRDDQNRINGFNDENSFNTYRNTIIQSLVIPLLNEYEKIKVEYPSANRDAIPRPPVFIPETADGRNNANLNAYKQTLVIWSKKENAILDGLKVKLGLSTPSVQDQSVEACSSVYSKYKGTYANVEVQVGNLELMAQNLENFALKSKALGLMNTTALEQYWYGQLGNLKQNIAGGYSFSSDMQNFKSVCATNPQYPDLANSIVAITGKYEELISRYNALSMALKKAIEYFETNSLGNSSSKNPIDDRNAMCISNFNSWTNEINSRVLDLNQIQDLMKQRMSIQIWVAKHPANSWSQVQLELFGISDGVNEFANSFLQALSTEGKFGSLCTGTESGPSILIKLRTLTESLLKLQLETGQLIKNDWKVISSKSWDDTVNSDLTNKICSDFYSAYSPTVSILVTELARLSSVAGGLNGSATSENAKFVANTQQLLIQLRSNAWSVYDSMKKSSGNITGCPKSGDLFANLAKIAEGADNEYNAFTSKWNVMLSSSSKSPEECSKFMSYYQQRASSYMDLYRAYISIWISKESIQQYIKENRVQTWQSVYEIFMNKTASVANMVNSDRNEVLTGRMQTVCAGVKDGDLYMSNAKALFSSPGPLTQLNAAAVDAIKNGISLFGRTPIEISSDSTLSQQQMCHATEGYYSQLSNSIIFSLQNLGAIWSNLENILAFQKIKGASISSLAIDAQSQLNSLTASISSAVMELKDGKLVNACKELSFSSDYQAKIDSLFNPVNGTVQYWYAITAKNVSNTYLLYQKSLEKPVNESENYCKNFSVESLKTITNVRMNISAIREKFRFTSSSPDLSEATKSLSYQNMGSALLSLQNTLVGLLSELQEYQKSSKCGQISELVKQASSAVLDLKGTQEIMARVGWSASNLQEQAITTVINAEKVVGADAQAAEVKPIEEKRTVVDQVKASVTNAKQTNLQIVTNYPNTKLTVIAKRSSSTRKITYSVTTSSSGLASLKAPSNLKGYRVTIYVGGIALSKTSV